MSSLSGVVGNRKVRWIKAPVGATGVGEVEVDGKNYSISWKRDSDGISIQFANGCFGFDIYGESDDGSSNLVFRISQRGSGSVNYGLRFKGEAEAAATSGGDKKKTLRVRAQMPGKIVRVLVKAGDEVTKDQPLLVMEAMKMENEIRAACAGKIGAVKVVEGQAVESGADLILIGG